MRKIYHFIVRFLCVVGSVQTIGLTTRAKIPKKYTSLSKFPDWSAQLFNKNIIYLILLIGFFLNNQIQVFGQANRFELGIEVFPNISSLNGTEYKNGFYEPILNFGSGVFFQYNIRKHFALRTSIRLQELLNFSLACHPDLTRPLQILRKESSSPWPTAAPLLAPR